MSRPNGDPASITAVGRIDALTTASSVQLPHRSDENKSRPTTLSKGDSTQQPSFQSTFSKAKPTRRLPSSGTSSSSTSSISPTTSPVSQAQRTESSPVLRLPSSRMQRGPTDITSSSSAAETSRQTSSYNASSQSLTGAHGLSESSRRAVIAVTVVGMETSRSGSTFVD